MRDNEGIGKQLKFLAIELHSPFLREAQSLETFAELAIVAFHEDTMNFFRGNGWLYLVKT
jgi:hypothetical protein